MAQTKKKRQTKHRGNAAGIVEVRGRTGRPPSPEEKKRQARETTRQTRLSRPPSWKIAFRNSSLMAVVLFVIVLITGKHSSDPVVPALIVAVLAFVVYVPLGYYMEQFMWRRRMRNLATAGTKRDK